MCDENYQLPDSVAMYGGTLNVNTSGVNSTPLRYCAACMTWVAGRHDCQWAGNAAYPPSSTNLWRCGGCGHLVGGAFHTCAPLTFAAPQPERRPHVCPLCMGKGELPKDEPSTPDEKEICRACAGACVLWG